MRFATKMLKKTVTTIAQLMMERAHKDYIDPQEVSYKDDGKPAYFTTLLSMFLFAFGAMTAYMIVIGDTVPAVVAQTFNGQLEVGRSTAILVSALSVVLPLCLFKELSTLSWSSLISVSASVLLVFIVSACAPGSARAQGQPFPPQGGYELASGDLFVGLGALSFAFVCQHNSFIVFRSLSEPTLGNWSRVSNASVGFALFLCLVFGLSGYISFGSRSKGDILLNFDSADKTVAIARAFLAVSMALTFPQECFVARHCALSLLELLFGGEGIAGDSFLHTFAFYSITLVLFATSTIIALVCSDLGVVLALVGAVAASMLGYVLPACFFLAAHEDDIRSWHRIVFSSNYDGSIEINKEGGFSDDAASSLSPHSCPSSLLRTLRFVWPYSLPLGMILFGLLALVLGVASVFSPPMR